MPVRLEASAVVLLAAVLLSAVLVLASGWPTDLIVVLDGTPTRSASPPQPMPQLLQGYDTVTQITALSGWLQRRPAPAPRRIWIATDPGNTGRAVALARITLAGRGIQIRPDPPATSQPQRAPQAPSRRPAPRSLAIHRQHRRLACAPDRCPQTGRLWGVGLAVHRLAFP